MTDQISLSEFEAAAKAAGEWQVNHHESWPPFYVSRITGKLIANCDPDTMAKFIRVVRAAMAHNASADASPSGQPSDNTQDELDAALEAFKP